MAEKKAKKEILTTKKAPEVQDRYEKAWRKLMGIDPSDLEMANSALNKHRQQLIDKIENVLDEKRRNLKEIEYTRLLDF